MSEVYNPETKLYERLEALAVEARQLAHKRDAAADADDRAVLDQQLREVEERIAHLRRRLKP